MVGLLVLLLLDPGQHGRPFLIGNPIWLASELESGDAFAL
jgi:hypothetical protein